MNNTTALPESQHAIQLVGPDRLQLNDRKPVPRPGAHQILLQIEAVGLCFSDLKLLKQFSQHPRKAEVLQGLDRSVLEEIPSYVPGDRPVVPGHEVVARIVAVGERVSRHQVGERVLVQTDYRDLKTAGSNAAFGYNFEGGLQEYVLVDERVVLTAAGERYLIPVPEELGASSVALVEPWACVECSYVSPERRSIKAGGRLLVVAEPGRAIGDLAPAFASEGAPAELHAVCPDADQQRALGALGIATTQHSDAAGLPDEHFDDIVYYGARRATIELLNDKLATGGIINIVLGGATIGEPVNVGVGRIHYGLTRWIGTTGEDAVVSYATIPETGELRAGDRVLVAGAGGPMGQMHVIRAASSGLEGLEIVATDFDDARLAALEGKIGRVAAEAGVRLAFVNPQRGKVEGRFTYIALMAPIGALVAQAVADSAPGCIINIFAGIPAPVKQELDLDTCIRNRCFMFGTSGSEIRDMHIVLAKLKAGRLDTDLSVDAVSGMAGAIDGLKAVENRTLAGKIIVYPRLHTMGLTPLTQMAEARPDVAAHLVNGAWNREAEAALLGAGK